MKRFGGWLVLSILLLPSAASAQHRGVLLDFEGWRAGLARSAVLVGLTSSVEIVARSDVYDQGDEIGVDAMTDEGVAKVARVMGLSVIVKGRVTRRGRRSKTKITILDADGRVLVAGTAPGPRNGRTKRKIRAVASRLVKRALADLPEPDEEAILDEQVGESPRRLVRPVVPKDEAPEMTDLEAANEELGLDPEIDDPSPAPSFTEPEPEPEPTRTQTSVRPRNKAARRLVAALGGFTFRARTARIGQTDQRNAQHTSGAFPELSVALRITPFKPKSTLGPAYLLFEGNYGLGVSSLERTDPVSSDAYRFAASVGYTFDVAFLDVGGVVGLGHDTFALGDNGVMGAARYTYVRLGGVARWPVSASITLTAEAGLRPVLSAGELGTRYGQGSGAFGFDLAAGLLGRTKIGFTYGVTASFTGYALLFSAPGPLSGAVTATGGFDRSLALSTLVGWSF
ncbi:MAG: hypothetical protein RIT81_02315 [Deltaproteobacteria bacterium]